MNIRKLISRWLLRPEVDRLSAITREMVNDYRMVPYIAARSPEALIQQLAEADPRLVDFITRQLRDYSLGMDASETFRIQVVKESRSLYLTDPITQFAIELWTDYAFGSAPALTAEDTSAQEVWNEFWRADRNAPVLGDRKLHKQSETQLIDGEMFYAVFVSTLDGTSTVRLVQTDQIKEIVKDPGDSSVPLYYKREAVTATGEFETVYYPDWAATAEQLAMVTLPADARIASMIKPETDVVMLHTAFREVNGRGWPLATASIDWSREYKQFLQNRAAVARAAATVVEKIKAKGGQRALDAMRSRLGSSLTGGTDSFETNPPPVAGSVWLENDAVDRQWMNRPTNSADAEKDGMALLTQAGLGYKLYPHYLGRGDTYRLATSTAMEGPTLKSFNRYQGFWSSVWRDLFKIVAGMAQRYGSYSFSSLESSVSTDRIITLDMDDIVKAISTVNDMLDRGLIDDKTAMDMIKDLEGAALETMGVKSAAEILRNANLPAKPEPAPVPPVVPPVIPVEDPDQPVPAEEGSAVKAPFAESFAERAADAVQYKANLRSCVYGLWSGQFSRAEFRSAMKSAIENGLTDSWVEALKSIGLTEDDMTEEEGEVLAEAILSEYSHIDGFADAIEAGSKANGGKLAALQHRLGLWVNRYNQVRSRALLMAGSNPPLRWEFGDTDHCSDCQYANGKVYRASVWTKWGWETQSQDLECNGYNCKCTLNPVPKGTRLTRGHPRRPHGGG